MFPFGILLRGLSQRDAVGRAVFDVHLQVIELGLRAVEETKTIPLCCHFDRRVRSAVNERDVREKLGYGRGVWPCGKDEARADIPTPCVGFGRCRLVRRGVSQRTTRLEGPVLDDERNRVRWNE